LIIKCLVKKVVVVKENTLQSRSREGKKTSSPLRTQGSIYLVDMKVGKPKFLEIEVAARWEGGVEDRLDCNWPHRGTTSEN
jgi:hypothetical protein